MGGHRRLTRAGLTNASFKLGSAAGNFLLLPFFLGVYGLNTYGVVSLLLSVAQYLSVLDLGLTGALVHEAARGGEEPDPRYFRLRRRIGLYLAAGGIVLTAAAAWSAPWWGGVVQLPPGLTLAVLGAGTITTTSLLSSCYNSFLIARLRFFHANLINLARNFVPQIGAALTYLQSHSLGAALAVGGLAALAVLAVQLASLRLVEPRHPPAGEPEDTAAGLRAFWRASVGFSLQSLCSIVLFPTLQVLVGMKGGPAAVAQVDAGRRLLYAGRNVVEALFVPVFSAASRSSTAGRSGEAARLALWSSAAGVALAVGFYGGVSAVLTAVLDVWLGPTGRTIEPVARVLLAGIALSIPQIGMYQVLSAYPGGRAVNVAAGLIWLGLLAGGAPAMPSVTAVLWLFAGAALGASLVVLAGGWWYLGRHAAGPAAREDDVGLEGA